MSSSGGAADRYTVIPSQPWLSPDCCHKTRATEFPVAPCGPGYLQDLEFVKSGDMRYPNAPITEAIIDIQTSGVSLESVHEFCKRVKADFPNQGPLTHATFLFDSETAAASGSREIIGSKIATTDGLYIAIPRQNGLTISRMPPYETWEYFTAKAYDLWKSFRDVTNPETISRLAVRNINRIDIPTNGEPVDLREYFRTSPELSPDLPEPMDGFFMQVMLPISPIKCNVIINQAIVPGPIEKVLKIILDIDIYRSEECPTENAEIQTFLDQVRQYKNSIFEACITERARELFK